MIVARGLGRGRRGSLVSFGLGRFPSDVPEDLLPRSYTLRRAFRPWEVERDSRPWATRRANLREWGIARESRDWHSRRFMRAWLVLRARRQWRG